VSAGLAYSLYRLHVRPSLCCTSASEVAICDLRHYTSVVCLCLYTAELSFRLCRSFEQLFVSEKRGLNNVTIFWWPLQSLLCPRLPWYPRMQILLFCRHRYRRLRRRMSKLVHNISGVSVILAQCLPFCMHVLLAVS